MSETLPMNSVRRADCPEQDLDLVVDHVDTIADGVVAVTLRRADGEALPSWSPGAHLDVRIDPDVVRQYSLCGDPDDRDRWRIAVLRTVAGRGGSERVHALRPGDALAGRGPRNHFELEPSPRYLFIAGGIGITPILGMITEAEHAGACWHLLYGGRTRSSMAFHEELSLDHPDRVTIHPEDESGLLDLREALGVPMQDTLVYCCGPEPLLAAVEAACEAWPEKALRVERFTAKATDPDVPAADTAIEVEFRASGVTLQVAACSSILSAAEEAGLPVVSSCQEGICGTCETVVLEGEPDHRDSVLSPAEQASGEVMMICCSRARSARLVLNL
ncbi:PDR/VanB family oxidoreductase [Pseudonocardia sp.]|jgi:ferredoxin-NADP reductase|uniref:PDR/VanB family oxidoreductase n=1 Tax=Pseudonocardia sp. TaxID=60912 RepID=UPI003D0E33B4